MSIDPRLTFRPASPQDRKAVVDMVNAMADYDKMDRLDDEAQARLIRDAFEHKKVEFIFAEWEGKPVGYVSVFETYSTFEARPTLFIDDLFVMPDYRGRHVAYELFRHCLREAKRRDCGRMEWMVKEDNLPAFGFYDHLQAKRLKNWVPFRLSRADIQKMARHRAMKRITATDALLKDHLLVNKILEQFSVENPRFSHIAKTLHRAVLAHAWFEDEIFLPAVQAEPQFFKRFTEQIYQDHKDIDALLKLVRKTSMEKRSELESYVLQLRVLLSTHFRKEEDALFPITERVLSNEGLLELGDEMQRRQLEVRQFIDR